MRVLGRGEGWRVEGGGRRTEGGGGREVREGRLGLSYEDAVKGRT